MEILLVILAYLFGSISWALVIGKVFFKTDLRQHGSHNLGGTNAGRVLGKKVGLLVMILDLLKAFISIYICVLFSMSNNICVLAGLACCFGHCFPIFAGFKGGKAVATAFGYLVGISLLITNQFVLMALVPFISLLISLYITKMVSLSSIVGVLVAVIISFIVQDNLVISFSILALWLFITYRHKANIKRIINHEESKISWM